MPDPADTPEDKAHAAATEIGDLAGHLWLLAHVEGIRDGLEVAAVMADACLQVFVADEALPAEVRRVVIDLLSGLRDRIRLQAHQVPEPAR
ncbi:hypothetical protein [Mycolicibacterium mucogenicum]|uniref:Uncharacterized protein n=1 Tax=Mycolicibacterium mucogenicum DSM 44124 TaxID=1226753 RepID=A0A8H2J8Z8_MYCMU|nr:hypothetical protein [Mycolicibacterium mucogenicum]KAB7761786.1 hypothetical protein MMUC44124_01095 [Mycolicibacterium mucogenicum DSM 44124]QPG70024.1 hypothetical protein C1S78_003065 [Mycolicibacterium mucogenicum DSM 44124]